MKFYHYLTKEKLIFILNQKHLHLIPAEAKNLNDCYDFDDSPIFVYVSNTKISREDKELYYREILKFCKENKTGKNKSISDLINTFGKDFFEQALKTYAENLEANEDGVLNLDRNGIFASYDFTNQFIGSSLYCYSTSEVNKNIVMWGHYSRKDGACLEYEFSDDYIQENLIEVEYKSNFRTGGYELTDFFRFISNPFSQQNQDELLRRKFGIKHSIWSYEQEYRHVLRHDRNKPDIEKPKPLEFAKNLKAIYFNYNTDVKFAESIKVLVQSNKINIKFYIAEKHKYKMQYVFSPL